MNSSDKIKVVTSVKMSRMTKQYCLSFLIIKLLSSSLHPFNQFKVKTDCRDGFIHFGLN